MIFFFNDTATTEIYTLSLHDALPIWTLFDGANGSCSTHIFCHWILYRLANWRHLCCCVDYVKTNHCFCITLCHITQTTLCELILWYSYGRKHYLRVSSLWVLHLQIGSTGFPVEHESPDMCWRRQFWSKRRHTELPCKRLWGSGDVWEPNLLLNSEFNLV